MSNLQKCIDENYKNKDLLDSYAVELGQCIVVDNIDYCYKIYIEKLRNLQKELTPDIGNIDKCIKDSSGGGGISGIGIFFIILGIIILVIIVVCIIRWFKKRKSNVDNENKFENFDNLLKTCDDKYDNEFDKDFCKNTYIRLKDNERAEYEPYTKMAELKENIPDDIFPKIKTANDFFKNREEGGLRDTSEENVHMDSIFISSLVDTLKKNNIDISSEGIIEKILYIYNNNEYALYKDYQNNKI